MLKTNSVYFFDSIEFEEIIQHYLDTGKHSLAKKAVKLGEEQHPSSVLLKLLKVELLIFEDKLNKALYLLSDLEVVEPNNEDIYIQKAIIFSKKGKHKDAITILNKAVKYAEFSIDIWSMIGMEYLYLNNFKKARLNFIKCIEVDLEDYSSLYNLIYCFDMENNHKEAIQFLNSYIDTNPYCEVAWHQLGRQYFTLEMYKEALTSFNYAVLIDENFIGGYLEKAKTLEELERYEEAIDNYLTTINLDDPTAFAYVRIGECYEKLNKISTAIKYYKKAVYEDPLLDKGWILLTNAYCYEKDYQKAIYYVRKAIQIDENNVLYWCKYAEINLKLNSYKEAIRAFYKCIFLENEAIETYIGLADALLFLGDYKDALKTLIIAKKRYRQFAEIEYRLCGLFYILGKKKYSFTHLKNSLALDFEFHFILKELFLSVFESKKIQKIIVNYKKSTDE